MNIQLFGGRGGYSGGTFIYRNRKLPKEGKPNSRHIQYKNDQKISERVMDGKGLPKYDIDYTNHGNPKRHPNVPHVHYWDHSNKIKPRGDQKSIKGNENGKK